MIDATAAALDVNDSMKTTSLLKDMDEVMKKQADNENFVISDEEKAKIECLKGQVGSEGGTALTDHLRCSAEVRKKIPTWDSYSEIVRQNL